MKTYQLTTFDAEAEGYAGCESKYPLICRNLRIHDGPAKFRGDLIVDGPTVTFNMAGNDGFVSGWIVECETFDEAFDFACDLIYSPTGFAVVTCGQVQTEAYFRRHDYSTF